eukprot:TRINITY_DN7770_c0_g1_i5.p1 TRINITY_DN7770_c0_g1~~TRINITY_DN7770_c0_g1_i5.p1  ORF type:complete len:124 (-),score=26.94 TRINITY_DN7770_c0_g1_i5:170-541(-)
MLLWSGRTFSEAVVSTQSTGVFSPSHHGVCSYMSEVIEVDITRSPNKAPPAVAKRLESSPKTLFPSTPEKRQHRQEHAALVRKNLFETKTEKAKAEVEKAKTRAAQVAANPKQESPQEPDQSS